MIKHDKKLSNNPEADQLWKEFDRALEGGDVTDDQISKASEDKNIQCLSYRALAVIIGKIQVALGAVEMAQAQSPNGRLQALHAKLQVLGGTMFPYLAVRLKQSPRSLLDSAIDACRTGSPGQVPGEVSAAGQETQTNADEAETKVRSGRQRPKAERQENAVG